MILVISFHFRRQQVGELQQWQVPPGRLPEFHAALKKFPGLKESVYLATCNRSELYAVTEPEFDWKNLLHLWEEFCPGPASTQNPPTIHFEQKAIRHLFRVAASLDSMVLGETEILGQVRQAYLFALENKNTGPLFNRIFQQALACAKRVRTETGLGKNPTSVATVALRLAETIFGDFRPIQAMILGAGEMGNQIADYLTKREVGSLWISSRTPESTCKQAKRWGASVIPFEHWDKKLSDIDLLFTCLRAPIPLVTADLLSRHLPHRAGKKLCLIDLGVPRNTEELPRAMDDFYHYNMDDLTKIADANRHLRRQEMVEAEKRIEEELTRLFQRYDVTLRLDLETYSA